MTLGGVARQKADCQMSVFGRSLWLQPGPASYSYEGSKGRRELGRQRWENGATEHGLNLET